jgi:cytochrome c biogenesis protein CcdA
VLPQLRREQLPAVAAGALSGAAAAELWEPCVGADFGRLLNELPGQSVIGLGSLAVYLVGVLSPLAALAALVALVPDRLSAARPHVANAGAAVLALAAFTIAAGLEDEVVGHLVRWST